jgi:hypothetical protein
MTRWTTGRLAHEWLFGLLLGLVGAVGCSFSPSFPEGTITCTKNDDCPSGFTCMAGFCRSKPLSDAAPILDTVLPALDQTMGIDTAPAEVFTSEARPLDGGQFGIDLAAERGDAVIDVTPPPDVFDAGRDVAVDAGFDAPLCPEQCNVGATRCGTGGGLQTCRLFEGCGVWSEEVRCDGHKVCQGPALAANCQCPAPPTGCEGGAGSGCAGKTLRTCRVGPDGCIFEESVKVCPDATPCSGTFPAATCRCPTPPPECNGSQGAFCSTTSSVASCGLDVNGCLAILQQTTCPAGKPCTGTFPSSNCSCPAGPPECQNLTGTLCPGPGQIKTCGLNTEGCLAVLSVVDCPPGKACYGALPTAQCLCPPPPSECSSGAGLSCDASGNLVNCAQDANGCMTISRIPCSGSQICQGMFPSSRCACPPTPPGCELGAGRSCSGNNIANCIVDGSGCLVAGTVPCPAGKPCGGNFPNADCTCPTPPAYCTTVGNVCVNTTTLATCALDGNQCMTATPTSCSAIGKECTGTIPNAQCTCPRTEYDCSQGVGSYCSGSNTSIKCAMNSYQCMASTKSTCFDNYSCYAEFPNGVCTDTKPLGWYNHLGSAGKRLAGSLAGHPINSSTPFLIKAFGILAEGSVNAKIGLYSTSGSINAPVTLVAQASPVAIVTGRNEFRPTWIASSTPLPKGNYWIMISYETQAQIAQDSSSSATVCTVSHHFVDDLPNPMGNGLCSSNSAQSNYYIIVTPQ